MHGLFIPKCAIDGSKNKKVKFSKLLLYTSTIAGKNYMHCNDGHEALYQNCKNHGSWVLSPGPMMGPIWSHSEIVLI